MGGGQFAEMLMNVGDGTAYIVRQLDMVSVAELENSATSVNG